MVVSASAHRSQEPLLEEYSVAAHVDILLVYR